MAELRLPLPEKWRPIGAIKGVPYMDGFVPDYVVPSEPAALIAWVQYLVEHGVDRARRSERGRAEGEHGYDGPEVTWRLQRPATPEEVAAQEAKAQRDREAKQQRERAEFERLKAKFGGAK